MSNNTAMSLCKGFILSDQGEVWDAETKKPMTIKFNQKGAYIKVAQPTMGHKYAKSFTIKYVHTLVFEAFNNRKVATSRKIAFRDGQPSNAKLENLVEVRTYLTKKEDGASPRRGEYGQYNDTDISWMGAGDTIYV